MLRGAIQAIYLASGVFIAYQYAYLTGITGWKTALSALGGVLLWPLVLMGVSLHLGPL